MYECLLFNTESVFISLYTGVQAESCAPASPHQGCYLLPAIVIPLPHSHCKREPGKINRPCSLPSRSLHWPWKGRGYQNQGACRESNRLPAPQLPSSTWDLVVFPLTRLLWNHWCWGHPCCWDPNQTWFLRSNPTMLISSEN